MFSKVSMRHIFDTILLLHIFLSLRSTYNDYVCNLVQFQLALYVADSPSTIYKIYLTGHINVAGKRRKRDSLYLAKGRPCLSKWMKRWSIFLRILTMKECEGKQNIDPSCFTLDIILHLKPLNTNKTFLAGTYCTTREGRL